MDNLTERQLNIIRYSLIQTRQKYYDITSNLFVSGNNEGFNSINNEIQSMDELLDKIDLQLKSKQK